MYTRKKRIDKEERKVKDDDEFETDFLYINTNNYKNVIKAEIEKELKQMRLKREKNNNNKSTPELCPIHSNPCPIHGDINCSKEHINSYYNNSSVYNDTETNKNDTNKISCNDIVNIDSSNKNTNNKIINTNEVSSIKKNIYNNTSVSQSISSPLVTSTNKKSENKNHNVVVIYSTKKPKNQSNKKINPQVSNYSMNKEMLEIISSPDKLQNNLNNNNVISFNDKNYNSNNNNNNNNFNNNFNKSLPKNEIINNSNITINKEKKRNIVQNNEELTYSIRRKIMTPNKYIYLEVPNLSPLTKYSRRNSYQTEINDNKYYVRSYKNPENFIIESGSFSIPKRKLIHRYLNPSNVVFDFKIKKNPMNTYSSGFYKCKRHNFNLRNIDTNNTNIPLQFDNLKVINECNCECKSIHKSEIPMKKSIKRFRNLQLPINKNAFLINNLQKVNQNNFCDINYNYINSNPNKIIQCNCTKNVHRKSKSIYSDISLNKSDDINEYKNYSNVKGRKIIIRRIIPSGARLLSK